MNCSPTNAHGGALEGLVAHTCVENTPVRPIKFPAVASSMPECSISSSPGDSKITIHIRVLGRWTAALHSLISEKKSSGGTSDVSEVCAAEKVPFGDAL